MLLFSRFLYQWTKLLPASVVPLSVLPPGAALHILGRGQWSIQISGTSEETEMSIYFNAYPLIKILQALQVAICAYALKSVLWNKKASLPTYQRVSRVELGGVVPLESVQILLHPAHITVMQVNEAPDACHPVTATKAPWMMQIKSKISTIYVFEAPNVRLGHKNM